MTLIDVPGSSLGYRPRTVDAAYLHDQLLGGLGAGIRRSEHLFANFPSAYDPRKRLLIEWLIERINGLLDLPSNWDGDGAVPTAPTAARAAIDVIESVSDFDTLPPDLFPLPSGGVQLEWLIDGSGLELEVTPDGRLLALGTDRHGKPVLELEAVDRADYGAYAEIREHLRTISLPLRPAG